jgi:hypothetical protein
MKNMYKIANDLLYLFPNKQKRRVLLRCPSWPLIFFLQSCLEFITDVEARFRVHERGELCGTAR